MKPLLSIAASLAFALTLSACELRRDSEAEDPASGETPAPDVTASPTPGQSASPVASIIRDEAAASAANAVLPVEPVHITLPFPDGSDIDARVERRLAGLMQEGAIEKRDWPVILAGHTDSGGNDQANLRASRARAEAVAAWLVERGVDDDRIEVIAFGEQNPIKPNALPDGSPNEEGRRANRRVEIRIAPPAEEEDSDADENAQADQDA